MYKIINDKNDKKYIGITTDPARRLREHFKKNSGCLALGRAIKKYGKDSFSMVVLTVGSDAYIEDLEIEAIQSYKSLAPNGYNLSLGGNNKNIVWDDKHNELLGKVTDKELASLLNISVSSVRAKRVQLNVPAFRKNNKNTFLANHLHLLGRYSDNFIAKLSGIPASSVQEARVCAGIAAYKNSGKCKELPKNITDLLGEVPDKALAKLAGVSSNSLRIKRNILNIPSFFEFISIIQEEKKEYYLKRAEAFVNEPIFKRYITPKGYFLHLDSVCLAFEDKTRSDLHKLFKNKNNKEWQIISATEEKDKK